MAITRPEVGKKSGKGGFMVRVSDHRSMAKADIFIRPVSGKGKGHEKDAFSFTRKKKGKHTEADAFAFTRNSSKSTVSTDFFATKRTRSGLYNGSDSFLAVSGRRGNHSNLERPAFGNMTPKTAGNSRVRKDHFKQRKERHRMKKAEPQPFARKKQLDQQPQREPQMSLWGGTVGKRGREGKRKSVPLPKAEDDGGNSK